MIKSIDINCDMGESYGHFKIGQDEALMPFISSCNIACGFHGGDPTTMLRTLEAAARHGLAVGAHPSYLNLRGFGREPVSVPAQVLKSDLMYQISALKGMAETVGKALSHVKAHGYLYHQVNEKEAEATCLIEVVEAFDKKLAVMGRPSSLLEKKCQMAGIPFIREGFLDRRYVADGQLQSRKLSGAVHQDLATIEKQLLSILLKQEVEAADGTGIEMDIDSLCIHGDHAQALTIARMVHQRLQEEGIHIQSSIKDVS